MTPRHRHLARLLPVLQARLLAAGLWNNPRPATQDFASQVPFCMDCMSLPQWLEFVLLPRLQALVDSGGPLPQQCAITEQMTQVLADHPQLSWVTEVTVALDQLLTQGKPPPLRLLQTPRH